MRSRRLMVLSALLVAASSLAALPFRAPARPSGIVAVKLYPMEKSLPVRRDW